VSERDKQKKKKTEKQDMNKANKSFYSLA
jgi:hypothetical protein